MADRHGIGANSEISLPRDKAEASKILFNRLVKLNADKKAYGESARDFLMDARKAKKGSPRVVRLGLRLSRMTPEKREKWGEEISGAAEMFGFGKLEVGQTIRDKPEWNLLEAVALIEDDRREIAEEIKALCSYATERGDLDVKSIRKLASMAGRKPKDEIADEWANLDTMGAFLGLW